MNRYDKEERIIQTFQDLKRWMIKKEYIIVRPNDKSVMFNTAILEFFEPLVYRKNIEILEEENQNKQLEIENLRKIIEGMQASRTWKITEPIRKLKKILKRG